MKRVLFFLCFFCAVALGAQEVHVSAEIYPYQAFEGQNLRGSVSVTHPRSMEVDETSFRVGQQSVEVKLEKAVPISSDSDLVVSIYLFQLPARDRGLHVLPSMSVKVGGQLYRSLQSTYEVKGRGSATPIRPTSAAGQLLLKAYVRAPEEIYPGERFAFVYRFYFTGAIELAEETLPLLNPEGFQKVGKKEIKDDSRRGVNLREITQWVEAIEPGTFSFPGSMIKGVSYQEDLAGRRVYARVPLESKTEPLSVVVLPFPAEGQPPSFSGALGDYQLRTTLLSSDVVQVGQPMRLSVEVSGSGAFHTVTLADLCCLPGVSGLFALDDLPPVGKLKGNRKEFVLELKPLSVEVMEIPQLLFTFFDPREKRYVTRQSASIPITVRAAPGKGEMNGQQEKSLKEEPVVEETLEKIAIRSNEALALADLYNRPFGSPQALWLLPLALLLLLLQWLLRNYLRRRQQTLKQLKAITLFQRALAKRGTEEGFHLFTRSFLLRLVEIGEISEEVSIWNALSKEGVQGEVRAFLSRLEKKHYAGQGENTQRVLEKEAQQLFERMVHS